MRRTWAATIESLDEHQSHMHVYNTAHQRTKHTRPDASYLNFSYDNIGQLTVVRATNSGGTIISAETKGYLYDVAWNLNKRTNNSSGSTTTFSVDSKNQLTSGPYGNAYYDNNGNITSDNSHSYSYDAENQLVQVLWGGGNYRTDFVYDGRQRLRVRKEYYYSSGWQLQSETRYVYDGLRVIQERNGSNTPTVAYTRGNDLSGSLEGAGGIGGLLARSHTYSGGSFSTHNFYHADGGGNVTYLVNSSQTLAASYKYDAFGNTVTQSGSLASANVYRFSSKEWIYEGGGGYYYYGYRFYFPNLQRWLNRDPLAEGGGINLYGFVGNHPINQTDPFGLQAAPPVTAPAPPAPPPVAVTPKPGPPVVIICTLEFCCVYALTAYVCDKTGFHDKLADAIVECTKSDYDDCVERCDKAHDRRKDECFKLPTKREQRLCMDQVMEDYADCLKDCAKRFGK